MKKFFFVLLFATASAGLISQKGFAQTTPAGAALASVSDESPYYKFVSLVHTANLDATLAALGTYTCFAPQNIAFRNMSGGRIDSLTSDPAKLAMVLKGEIVKGKITKADITKKLTLGKGKATLTNILGQPLKLSLDKKKQLSITDINGHQVYLVDFDTMDPHAVIHGVDNVLM